MAPSHIFQIFLWIAIQNQIDIAQRVIVDEIIQLRPLRHGHIQFRWKQGIRSVFQRAQKIRTLLLLEKSSDFVVVVHLQGLEPWAH